MFSILSLAKMLRVLLGFVVLSSIPASAQLVPPAAPEELSERADSPDPFERETPQDAVTRLLNALGDQNYSLAANYFDLPDEGAQDDSAVRGAELSRQLQAALDAGGSLLPFGALSDEPSGRIDDQLPIDMERVGTLSDEEDAPILLSQSQGPDGTSIWRVSSETIEQLQEIKTRIEDPTDSSNDKDLILAGAPVQDWALLIGIAAGSLVVFWLISKTVLAIIRTVVSDREKSLPYRLASAALPPISLILAVVAFHLWAGSVEASIVARQFLLRYIGILGWLGLVWLAIRLVDAAARVITARMRRRERRQAISVITLVRRSAKVLLLVIAVLAVLDTLGFDMTTGVAALGLGGLALALGAQKTVENLVGSISVIADKPVQVGDFCRVGSVVGTVEDVGMRSTRVRTLDRTLVTIPNGDFASREIENYAKRDRFLFNPTIGLEYGLSAAKLREAVGIIEKVLRNHELVDDEDARARFAEFGASSLDIEVWAYITVADYAESRLVRQELLLEMLDRLESAGMAIAFPTRTIHVVQDEERKTQG
ncbi:mechanosensitive ion channel family protein [Aurantiacibacter zhengii]|uniref:Mechanosensitive ion channel family protein n=1 Tax=Aurantiacibacter zhengii TaxID=2307003 RepID=A0A418NQ78_9SPHN|nr:mechanosensitive ion channel family protein [Aurantiacibacter zhengii]RIV84610.1 mechanosensitive ion channel family protein [Aurantiacibacter zhengii]